MNNKVKKIVIIVCLLAVIVVGGYFAISALFPSEEGTSGPLYTTAKAQIGDIKVGVDAIGNLQAGYGGSISVPYNRDGGENVSYKVDKILVKSGDLVKAGQVLIQLAAPDLSSQIKSAQEAVDADRKALAALLNVKESQVDYANPDNGITLFAPFDGKVNALSAAVGTKFESGSVVCKVVDDSNLQMTIYLTASEVNQIKDNTRAIFRFGGDTYIYEAKIEDVNRNAIAMKSNSEDLTLDSGMGVENEGYEFVYEVTLSAPNPGLLFPGSKVSMGFYEPAEGSKFDGSIPNGTRWSRYVANIKQFTEEETLVSTAEGVVTKVIAKNSATVKQGDPILVIAGQEVRTEIERRLTAFNEKKEKLQSLKSRESGLTIVAPSTGMVAEINKKEGDSVSNGEWLGSVFSSEQMYMTVYVDDIDIVKVTQAAPVTITLDALPDQEFSGTVNYVSGNSSDRGYTVEIGLSGSEEMRSGMQARAYIDSGSANGVLLIPAEAVFKEENVYKVEVLNADGTVTVKNIEVGLSNDRFVEVTSGLEEGEEVITGSTTDLLPSQKVDGNDNGLLPPSDNGGGDDGGSTDGGGDMGGGGSVDMGGGAIIGGDSMVVEIK